MLNDRFVRNAKPGLYSDGLGLYLQVYPSGRRVFVLRDQSGGRQRKQVLGAYPALSLAEARARTERIRSGESLMTASDAWAAYYRHLKTQYRAPEQVERLALKDFLPAWGPVPINDISRADYTGLLQAIVDRDSPVMANRTLTALKKFLAFCHQRGWVSSNALEGVQRQMIGGKERSRSRNLSFDEIKTFLQSLPTWGLSDGTKWALVGCLLTGCRASEVLALASDGTLPNTKSDRPHRIPVTRLVRLWLTHRPAELPKDHRVLSHALRRQKQDFTPHDLRRTFASRLSDLGVAPHVIEKMLNHQMEGVMAVYNRAEYWQERVAAQRLWDRTLIKNPRR